MSQRALMWISAQNLIAALGLPPEIRLGHISQDAADFSADRVTLYLEGPGLPEVPEGYVAPIVVAEYEMIDGKLTFKRFA